MWHSAREPAQEQNRSATECHIISSPTATGETSSVLCPDAMAFPFGVFHFAEGQGSRFRLKINLGMDIGRI